LFCTAGAVGATDDLQFQRQVHVLCVLMGLADQRRECIELGQLRATELGRPAGESDSSRLDQIDQGGQALHLQGLELFVNQPRQAIDLWSDRRQRFDPGQWRLTLDRGGAIAHFDDGLGWWHEQFAQLFADPLVLVVEAAVWKDFSHAVPDLSGKQGCWLQVCNVGWARH
jgi:hypothetical protein